MDECIFCKIVAGTAPATKVYETGEVVVFKNIRPAAPVHLLVVPKRHIARLADTDDAELLGKLMQAVVTVAEQNKISDAFKVGILNGENAGQSVFHLHMHVLGGWIGKAPKDDGLE